MIYPLVKEIDYQDPLSIFNLFAKQNGAIFLDSALAMPSCGRYSFLAIDPFFTLVHPYFSDDNPFEKLNQELVKFPLQFHADLPPFQGGAVGFFSYDLCRYLEKVPIAKIDDMQFPYLAFGFYDLVIGFDNEVQKAWIFSSGYPIKEDSARILRAEKRLMHLVFQLQQVKKPNNFFTGIGEDNLLSYFTKQTYQAAVQRVKDYILAGDIFEANISQRFQTSLPPDLSPFELYCKMRSLTQAPFSAFVNIADTILVSASPERFLKLSGRSVETRPIKGTRPRGKTSAEDKKIAEELFVSEKDRAENIMIVDLLRNDLSRVCDAHSVNVPQLCGLESYATVHHLVSVVTGNLKKELNAIDLLRATFPGGSITGAPKIRAMEIIAEIEPTARGPYCGSIGYIGFNGDMDCSIVIRTLAIKNNKVTFQVGGAVVADSDPLAEYEETLTKAKALKKALLNASFFTSPEYDFTN